MFLTITNAEKGKPVRLSSLIDNVNKNLKIGLKRISGRVGWYNVEEDIVWSYLHNEQETTVEIKPRLYNFDMLAKELTSHIDGFEIEANKGDGKIDMTIPDEYKVLFPDQIREMLGLDDVGWLAGDYTGDHAIEFSPRRILVYLNALSTSENFQQQRDFLNGSELLEFIDLSNAEFGEYFVTKYEKPCFKKLKQNQIHHLDFDFKVEWANKTKKLDNHDQPIDLVLEIK